MNDTLQAQIATYLARLDGLIRRGGQLHDAFAADPASATTLLEFRMWQQDCGVTINELSGGSKAHWLARAFSQAFLVRSTEGSAVEEVTPHEIVQNLLRVLEQGAASLLQTDSAAVLSASAQAPAPHRFDFVHNAELRQVVEQAFADSRSAFEQGQYGLALRSSCGILEAIVTDALEHKGLSAIAAAPPGKISEWSFPARLAVAERAGLIRGGWVRLPAVAQGYRDDDSEKTTVSEQDARKAGQVLRVVMRDLDPGR